MYKLGFLFSILSFFLFAGNLSARFSFESDDSLKVHVNKEKDSLSKDTAYHHLWKHATIWSACLPGAGQIYNEIGYRRVQNKKNRAWWKVPIIYSALGVTGYYFYNNLITAQGLKREWLYRYDNGNAMSNTNYFTWSNDELLDGKTIDNLYYPGYDQAAKYRDLFAVGFIAVWGLNVVEALVDGHFVHFDVSEDLSFHYYPVLFDRNVAGIGVGLVF
ncbi:MAG: hypothetical protein IPM74_08355 [Crocinitomicaceae bacterium]|nr:hypothetical protein [Crocinitomicaceae bacterium]MBK8925909.1 hypothetical protein [Crocinitomicaceae bacterium]